MRSTKGYLDATRNFVLDKAAQPSCLPLFYTVQSRKRKSWRRAKKGGSGTELIKTATMGRSFCLSSRREPGHS